MGICRGLGARLVLRLLRRRKSGDRLRVENLCGFDALRQRGNGLVEQTVLLGQVGNLLILNCNLIIQKINKVWCFFLGGRLLRLSLFGGIRCELLKGIAVIEFRTLIVGTALREVLLCGVSV